MGGRKKTGKKEKKLRTYAIPKAFDCERCSEASTLQIQIQKKGGTKRQAKIFCVKCKYSTIEDVEPLDQPVDIYNKWCDEMTNADKKNFQNYDDEDEDGGLDIDADVDENDIPETEF